MDVTGSCFSATGESKTTILMDTRNVGGMEMLPVVAVNQKLDRLLQVATTQAEELREAKSANEDSQKQLQELNKKVASLE